MQSIAVIGAGAAGLCAARHCARKNNFRVVVYEKAESIGGTWVYKPWSDRHVNGACNTAMYESLITNLPKQVMQFPDFPFDASSPTYLQHRSVLQYLRSYCARFDLNKYIRFRQAVEHVSPVKPKSSSSLVDDVRWQVTARNLESDSTTSEVFDAVLVCCGHYDYPFMPNVPGVTNFKGKVIHSKQFKTLAEYCGQNVLVVGAGGSGVDIAMHVSAVAKAVYVSHRRGLLRSKVPENLFEVPELKRCNEDGWSVTFADEDVKSIDSILFCTGYETRLPFLDDACKIQVENNRVTHLYKHIVNIRHPSMLLLGLTAQIPPFRVFHIQTLFALAVLAGQVTLPSEAAMRVDEDEEFKSRARIGWPLKYSHTMTGKLVQYLDSISKMAGVDSIPKNIMELYLFVLEHRAINMCNFKEDNFILNSEGTYVIDRSNSLC